MKGISCVFIGILALVILDIGLAINHIPSEDWDQYKALYEKDYSNSAVPEALAQYYYAYNKRLIDNHNALFERGLKNFTLKVNQFTDMRFIHFNALFPATKPLSDKHDSAGPETQMPAPDVYNPEIMGYRFNVEDQGTKCNSGWAYAAAKAVEVLKAQQDGEFDPAALSAQIFIDCAGGIRSCKTQVPQTAFDYLVHQGMDLLLESEYINNKTRVEPGMCVARGTMPVNLAEYSFIRDSDDETLKSYVAAGFPVVVEFNPASFEFMHYADGVFTPPATRTAASHFMLVIGYDTDADGKDYWILQNSFGDIWGERGIMRLKRSSSTKIAKNAIFPSKFVAAMK